MGREAERAARRAQQAEQVSRGIPREANLVGKRLPGVSLSAEQRNAPFAEQVDAIVAAAQAASEPLHEQAGHVPALAPLSEPEGAWGVFCLRCSAEAKEYVYPCPIEPEGWPAQVLVAYVPPASE